MLLSGFLAGRGVFNSGKSLRTRLKAKTQSDRFSYL